MFESQHQERAGTNLRALLSEDHERLEKLFEEMLAAFHAGARDDAACLWAAFDARLSRHLKLEEESIFPAFAQVDPVEARQLLEEHTRIRQQLLELGVGVDLHLTRAQAVSEFIGLLRAHARREDALVYRWAEAHLSGEPPDLVRDPARST